MDAMDATASPACLFALEERNKLATAVIKKYAIRHAWTDVIMGVAAGVVPGGSWIATAAGVAIQPKFFYQPMVRKLAEIYAASPDDVTHGIVGAVTGMGAMGELLGNLVSEFGSEFMQEIIVEIAQDLGISAGLGLIPLIGKILSAGMDMTVATELTWAVGAMSVVYFLNGGQFMGTRKETYVLCKGLASQASQNGGGISLDDLPWTYSPLLTSVVEQLVHFVAATVHSHGFMTFVRSLLTPGRPAPMRADDIRGALESRQVPVRLVDEAIKFAAGKAIGQVA